MTAYVAILRGINVSGSKTIKMVELKKMFEELGFQDVATYIQSGNVIFKTEKKKDTELATMIHKAITDVFSFDVPVIVLEAAELRSIQHNNPFLKDVEVDLSKLHVTVMAESPDKTLVKQLEEAAQYPPDAWVVKDKTIYLFCPGGYGNTKLNNNFFEKKLKVAATTRNWKTINTLVDMTE